MAGGFRLPRVGLLYSGIERLHSPFDDHPERPERIEILLRGLRGEGLAYDLAEPARISAEELYRIHEREYVDYVKKISRRRGLIDSDTYVTEHSFEAALAAASAAFEAAERISSGEGLSISIARPPGHHAGRFGKALGAPTQGFCIFNNAALAAARLVEKGLDPVLVIDFDIHHGNGTQEIFWRDPRVVHVDLHDSSIYPGTGWLEDLGAGDGEGSKINIPLLPGARDPEYLHAWEEIVEPIARSLRPGAIVVSAGFDAHEGESMGRVKLSDEMYTLLGSRIRRMASENPRSPGIVVILEGGYGPGLLRGFPSFLRGLLQGSEPGRSWGSPRSEHRSFVEVAKRVLRRYHPL